MLTMWPQTTQHSSVLLDYRDETDVCQHNISRTSSLPFICMFLGGSLHYSFHVLRWDCWWVWSISVRAGSLLPRSRTHFQSGLTDFCWWRMCNRRAKYWWRAAKSNFWNSKKTACHREIYSVATVSCSLTKQWQPKAENMAWAIPASRCRFTANDMTESCMVVLFFRDDWKRHHLNYEKKTAGNRPIGCKYLASEWSRKLLLCVANTTWSNLIVANAKHLPPWRTRHRSIFSESAFSSQSETKIIR